MELTVKLGLRMGLWSTFCVL